MEPYSKRCSATKLTSAEKLMYICKNQLGKILIYYLLKPLYVSETKHPVVFVLLTLRIFD